MSACTWSARALAMAPPLLVLKGGCQLSVNVPMQKPCPRTFSFFRLKRSQECSDPDGTLLKVSAELLTN